MLILPLHKPLTLANLPLTTLLLVVANVLVFFGWQGGDEARLQAAQRHYVQSGLGAHEVDAYLRYLRADGQTREADELARLDPATRVQAVGTRTLTDVRFQQALREGALFQDEVDRRAWQSLRPAYDRQLDEVFTLRHMLRSSEWSPPRMFSAAFLHANLGHLLGNMLFLVVLGLLLEGAVGPWRLLLVYGLGALGSSAASLLWRWGEAGGGLGASGAVAAMMGAFCVVWGRNPVRFFYWFGVWFDYVRTPAIWLLPAWLGWEIYNLLANGDLGVGFDAHAGGLLCGAALGAVLVLTRQVRNDYMQPEPDEVVDDRWERAQRHLGRMENREAEELLAALADEQPHRADVAMARHRAAAHRGPRPAAPQQGRPVQRVPAHDGETRRLQAEAAGVLAGTQPPLDVDEASLVLDTWLALGRLEEAEALLLQGAEVLPRETQARQWFRLALQHGEQSRVECQYRLLQSLIERFPELPQAGKARFLLEQG